VVQAKLTVSDPRDPYEREADRVADQVMRTPDSPAHARCACGGTCPRCTAIMPAAQPGTAPDAPADLPAIVAQGTRGGGAALDSDTRAFMEARFGRDFGDTRVHADGDAAASVRTVGALAYTVGSDVVFGAGPYAPHAPEGRRLLAHELAHVVQQQGAAAGTVQRAVAAQSDCPAEKHEAPADALAEIVAADDRARTMALDASYRTFAEWVALEDPSALGDVSVAYLRRFGPPPRASEFGQAQNRFTGAVGTVAATVRGEIEYLSLQFARLGTLFAGELTYLCGGPRGRRVEAGRHPCEETVAAWTVSPDDFRTIVICPYFWTGPETADVDQRAAALIHEGVHVRFDAPEHENADPTDRGRNPDCYRMFLSELYGFSAKSSDCPPAT
jgi:hypothetical protein